MPFRFYSPGATIFSLVFAGVMSLFSRPKKHYVIHSDPQLSEEKKNLSAMQKIVSEYEGYSAEVININVFGRRHVETFRLLSPGRTVELKMSKGEIKVYAFGEFIANLIPPVASNLPRLFKEQFQFHAYLGGRDRTFLYDDTYDSCSIIIFYKMEGVPPTKVNLI